MALQGIALWIAQNVLRLNIEAESTESKIILGYYPLIINDLKNGWSSFKTEFLIGRHGSQTFPLLTQYDHDSRLRRVKKIDSNLYDMLKTRILGEIVPSIKQLNEKRDGSRVSVRNAWKKYIDNLRIEKKLYIRPRRVDILADGMISILYFDLTRGEFDDAKKKFDIWMDERDGIFDTWGQKANMPITFFDTLIDLFKENWTDVEGEYSDIIDLNDQWLNVRVINYMSTAIENT